MSWLLDTHTLLWWLADDPRLGTAARAAIAGTERPVFVSAATIWEVSIKTALGKLALPGPLDAVLEPEGFAALPITWQHAARAGALPPHHSDPFDRMLVAQALVEGFTLISRDGRLAPYGVKVLRA
ncbi:MAG: type II toxin-antitoxin system VapC family toxin [Candidatus Sericytochromatia bacterium]|nr:type II toxin-antitoxin system VapC family toxin [Candidatus Sericytochromatia bacterium]